MVEGSAQESATDSEEGNASTAAQVRRLYLAQALTQTGLWFRNVAVALMLIEVTGGATAIGWATVAQFLPTLLLGSWPGRWVDRVGPRRGLLAVTTVSVLSAACLTLTPARSGWVWLLFAAVTVAGVAQAAERPATFGLSAQLVGWEHVGPVLARHTVFASAGRFLGPGLAGVVYGFAGPRPCFLLTTLMCLAVWMLVASVRVEDRAGGRESAGSEPRDLTGTPDRALAWVLACGALVTVATMSFNVTITSMITLGFGAGSEAVGAAHMLNAVGAVAGGWVVSLRPRMGARALGPAALALGAGVLLLGAAGSVPVFLALSPVLGVALGAYQGTLQRAAQAAGGVRGTARTTSLVNVVTFGLAPVAALWSGYVVDLYSPRGALMLAGTGAVVAGSTACLAISQRRSPELDLERAPSRGFEA